MKQFLLLVFGCLTLSSCTIRSNESDASIVFTRDSYIEDCSCAPGQECHAGLCYVSDLTGYPCDPDNACPMGSWCVSGHCSRPLLGMCHNDPGGTPESRYCLDDFLPAEASTILPCRRGVQVCLGDTWTECVGAISPIAELGTLACNGINDDCEMCPPDQNIGTDGLCHPIIVSGFDVVFAFDISGSMNGVINSVRMAVDRFSTLYATNPMFRWGVVVFPSSGDTPFRVLDLSNFSAFMSTVSSPAVSTMATFSGSEPSIDTLHYIGDQSLRFSWRTDSIRIIIIFTDEEAQSYSTPPHTMSQACAQITHGESLYWFLSPTYATTFSACGTSFTLSNDVDTMFGDLNSIISDPCTH